MLRQFQTKVRRRVPPRLHATENTSGSVPLLIGCASPTVPTGRRVAADTSSLSVAGPSTRGTIAVLMLQLSLRSGSAQAHEQRGKQCRRALHDSHIANPPSSITVSHLMMPCRPLNARGRACEVRAPSRHRSGLHRIALPGGRRGAGAPATVGSLRLAFPSTVQSTDSLPRKCRSYD